MASGDGAFMASSSMAAACSATVLSLVVSISLRMAARTAGGSVRTRARAIVSTAAVASACTSASPRNSAATWRAPESGACDSAPRSMRFDAAVLAVGRIFRSMARRARASSSLPTRRR